ncbi:MAG: pinensin family lanthipeptide, partial [Cyclobacteriaceae bacterium]
MNLDALKVKSFVTRVDDKKNETVKGGIEIKVSVNICQVTNQPLQCTWQSELYT